MLELKSIVTTGWSPWIRQSIGADIVGILSTSTEGIRPQAVTSIHLRVLSQERSKYEPSWLPLVPDLGPLREGTGPDASCLRDF